MTHPWTRLVAGVVALGLIAGASPVLAKNPKVKRAEEEVEFGFKAARRGYWQEALERFQLADELTPNQPRILNNIAVAFEANGRFEEARAAYRTGLELDPSNSALRKNLQRFEEFYATFVAPDGDDDDGSGSVETPAADDGRAP